MMDPTMLAAAVVQILVPFFTHIAGRVEERAEEAATTAGTAALTRLYNRVRSGISADPAAGRVLDRVMARPNSERDQGALEYVLAEVLSRDPSLAASLLELFYATRTQLEVGPSQQIGSGAVAIGGDIHLEGHNVAGRDMVIGQKSDGSAASSTERS